jgi:hypothetical protein
MLQLHDATHWGALGTAIRTAPQWHEPATVIRGSLAAEMLSYCTIAGKQYFADTVHLHCRRARPTNSTAMSKRICR